MSFEDELERWLRKVVREELRAVLAEFRLGPADEAGDWLTITQAAKVLSVHHSTIRKLIKRGELVARGEGRLQRIRRRDLDACLKNQSTPRLMDVDVMARRIRGRGGR